MNVAEFLRQFEIRAPNIMWLLGAGASAAAGIPTAFHMIWDFKRTLYCSAQKVPISTCSDLSNSTVRARLQNYFDGIGTFPPDGSNEEYSHYFRTVYPDERDRRRYIERIQEGGSPSHGHIALACLLYLAKVRVVWTTNFDSMIEDAASRVFRSTSKLSVSTLDSARIAMEALNEGRWPVLVKLHGDFRSRLLKNTSEELQTQDAQLRGALIEACQRYGLAVTGYSGRDASVMDALEEGLDGGKGYPSGLYWFHRSDSAPLPRVTDLIRKARRLGVQANIIESETFDELLPDILLLIEALPEDLTQILNQHAPRLTESPLAGTEGRWPVLRTNALPIASYPNVCRRILCNIGGAKEVRQAIAGSQAEIIAARRNIGVIAFGRDLDVRRTFEGFQITQFDVHSIEAKRLRYESAELGLLYDGLSRALQRERPLKVERRSGHSVVFVDEVQVEHGLFDSLRKSVGTLTGTVSGTPLKWAEAARISLEYWLNQLWLVFEPTVWVQRLPQEEQQSAEGKEVYTTTREFIRDRLAGRFNPKWNELLYAWTRILTNGEAEAEVRAFGIGDGLDAVFQISSTTGFSKRGIGR